MLLSLYTVLIIIVIIECSTGVALNMCILIVHLKSVKIRQKLKPHDLIYLTKGLVNTLLQLFMTAEIMFVLLWFQMFFVKEVYLTTYISLCTLGFFDYWLTAFLCTYYCSAISNLHFVIFVWVKRSIKMFLPQLLLISAMGSILFSVPSIWKTSMKLHEQSAWNSTNDSMIIGGAFFTDHIFAITVGIFGCYLPFVLTFLSLVVTIFTLMRHILNIKDTNSDLKSPKLQVLINATRTMLLFLAVQVSFYFAVQFSASNLSVSSDLKSIISWFFVLFCPTAEALTIMQASSKMREIFRSLFCSTDRKRSNVETNNL